MTLASARTSSVDELSAWHIKVMRVLMDVVQLVILSRKEPNAVSARLEAFVDRVNGDFEDEQGTWISILFDGESISICGQLLCADEVFFGRAVKVMSALSRLNVFEVQFQPSLSVYDIQRFLAYLLRQQPLQSVEQKLSPRVRVRGKEASLLVGFDDRLAPQEVCARCCALAVVVMEAFYADAMVGNYSMLPQVKRVSQNLVVLNERYPRMLLAILGSQPGRKDRALLSVKSAVVAMLTLRKLTRDTRNIMDLVMSALLMDLSTLYLIRKAHPVMSAYRDESLLHQWTVKSPPEVAARQPIAGAAVMTQLGQMSESSLTRSVYVYEALHLEHLSQDAYPLEGSMTLESMVLYLSRAFVQLLIPERLTPSQGIVLSSGQKSQVDLALEGLAKLSQRSELLQKMHVLLMDAVGLVARGERVSLSGGYQGVVLANHERPSCFGRPVVRLLRRPSGEPMSPYIDVDLSLPVESSVQLGGVVNILAEGDDLLDRASAQIVEPAPKKPRISLMDALKKKKSRHQQEPVTPPVAPASLDEESSEFEDSVTQIRKAPVAFVPKEIEMESLVEENKEEEDSVIELEPFELDPFEDATEDFPRSAMSWYDEDTSTSAPSDRIQMLHASDFAHMVPDELLEPTNADDTQEIQDFSIAPFLTKPSDRPMNAQVDVDNDVTVEQMPRLSHSSIMSLEAFTSGSSSQSRRGPEHDEVELDDLLSGPLSLSANQESWHNLHQELSEASSVNESNTGNTSVSDRLIVLSVSQSEAFDLEDDEPQDTALLPPGVVDALMKRDRNRYQHGVSILDVEKSDPDHSDSGN